MTPPAVRAALHPEPAVITGDMFALIRMQKSPVWCALEQRQPTADSGPGISVRVAMQTVPRSMLQQSRSEWQSKDAIGLHVSTSMQLWATAAAGATTQRAMCGATRCMWSSLGPML